MRKLLCKLFGHRWQLDYPNLPTARCCTRCRKKQVVNQKETFKAMHLPTVWEEIEA